MKINRSLLNISIVYSLLGCNTSSVTDDLNKKNVINQFNFNQNEDVIDKNISNDDQTKFLEDQKNKIGLNNLSNTADKNSKNSIDNINKNNNDNDINGQPKTPSTNGTLNNNKPENSPHSTLDPIVIPPSPSIPTPPNYTSPGKTAQSPKSTTSSELSNYSVLTNNLNSTPGSTIAVTSATSSHTSQNSIYDPESSLSHSAAPNLIKTGKNNFTTAFVSDSKNNDVSSAIYSSYEQSNNEVEDSNALEISSLMVSPIKPNKDKKTVSFAENIENGELLGMVPQKSGIHNIGSESLTTSTSNNFEFEDLLQHSKNPAFSTIMDDSSFKINETDSVTMNWQYTNGYSTTNNSAMSNSTENNTNINEKFNNITINSKLKNKKEEFYQDNKLKITGASPLFYIKEGNETIPVYKQSDIEKLRFETCNNSGDENKFLNIKINKKFGGNFRIGDDRQTIIKNKDLEEKEIKIINITLGTDEFKKNIKTNIGVFNDEGRYCFVCYQKDHKNHGSEICKLNKIDKHIFDVETDYWIIIFYNKVEEIKVLSLLSPVVLGYSPAAKIDIKNSRNHVAFPIKKMNLRECVSRSKFIKFYVEYESSNSTSKKATYNVISILEK